MSDGRLRRMAGAASAGGPRAASAVSWIIATAVAVGAVAQPYDVRLIPPNVLFILDTSGSMQYLRQEHNVPVCTGVPGRDNPSRRTRWMKVMDALLGPIPDDKYFCRAYTRRQQPPYGTATTMIPFTGGFRMPAEWFIPHFLPCGGFSEDPTTGLDVCDPTANRNLSYGILERYRERIRFGVATFDSFYATDSNLDGMWSYGDDTRSWFDPARQTTISLNVGLRTPDTRPCDPNPRDGQMPSGCVPGGLVDWGGDDTDTNTLNSQVRQTILETVPYCGSPIAAALVDAARFFASHESNMRPENGGTDRFWACRERFVVLITDGLPNTGEGNPYPTSDVAANSLYSTITPGNIPMFTIGFSLCPDGTPDGIEVRNVLNAIAQRGCPSSDSRCPPGIVEADDADELIAALDNVLYRASSQVTSRTLVQLTSQTTAEDPPKIVQYQFNTALRTSGTEPWEGIVERVGYRCNSSGRTEVSTDVNDYLDYGLKLNERTTPRRLRTVLDPLVGGQLVQRSTPFPAPVALEPFETANADVTVAQLGGPGRGAAWRNSVIDFMHGAAGTPRATRRLADVYHASAEIIGRPAMDLPIVSYYQYQKDNVNRLQLVYVATNDGTLHGFRANDTADVTKRGEELWGYIPNALLKQVANQIEFDGDRMIGGNHMPNLDSTPAAGDMRMFKDGDPLTPDDDWRAVVVGGYRQGAYGYYALDVTDPDPDPPGDGPKLLWEITDETQDESHPGLDDYADLGLTYATPMLGTVFIPNEDMPGAPLGEVAVAIFPGGFNPTDPMLSTTGLYIVSLKTGRLIRKLSPVFPSEYACGAATCTAKPECCAQLMTSPVGYGSMPGTVTSRVFVGDDRGRMWRADFSSQDITKWSLDLFYPTPVPPTGDPDAPYGCASCTRMIGPPVKFPPSLALNDRNEIVVIFGAGDVDNVPRIESSYMFSLREKMEYDGMTGTFVGRAHHNWTRALDPGEKLTGVPIVFNKVAYFATFVPTSNPLDACELGKGRIWGVVYDTDDPNKDGDKSDWAALDRDGLLGGEADMRREYANTYIAGLAALQRPACIDTGVPPMPGLSAGSADTYEIVAQVGGDLGAPAVPSSQVPLITIPIPTPPVAHYADSWAGVFE